MSDVPHLTKEQIADGCATSTQRFRDVRIQEPLDAYVEVFDEYQAVLETVLEQTVDLSHIRQEGRELLSNPKAQEALRYLMGPPISTDDLKIVADAASLNPARLKADPELVQRLIQVVLDGLDRRRFVWVSEERDPTEAEKHAAIVASAALIASQRLATSRRNQGKNDQELAVEEALVSMGLQKTTTRTINTLAEAPASGFFCRESKLGERKADFVVGLFDNRVMAIECKVSNSSTNSVKRLNNDAAVKAEVWFSDFGRKGVVPAAVLSGVYKAHNVESAQKRGLSIFWAHDLVRLTDWISSTKPA